MKKLLLSLLFIGGGFITQTKAQIFSQSFNSSSDISSYFSATPNNGQFDAVSTTNTSTATASIVNNTLRLSRSANTSGTVRASRITDLSSPAPIFLSIQFSITVSDNTTSKLSAATFVVGSNFTTNASADANVNARFSINLSATDGNFSLRKFKPSATSSSEFSGKQTIIYFINNTGGAKSYTAPNGSTEQIADKTADLWIGTSKVFDDTPQDGDFDISDFKIIFDGGSSTPYGFANIDIDDIVINNQTTVLPVSLSSFTAKPNLQNVDLAWSTASEQENEKFEILRSGDGKNFTKVGEIKGAGTTTAISNYNFTDKNALPGTSYYQLKQIDFNGKHSTSAAIAVKSNVKPSNFAVNANSNDASLKVSAYAANESIGKLNIYDLNGRKIVSQTFNLSKGYSNFSLPFNGSKGLYIASLSIGNETLKQKFIK